MHENKGLLSHPPKRTNHFSLISFPFSPQSICEMSFLVPAHICPAKDNMSHTKKNAIETISLVVFLRFFVSLNQQWWLKRRSEKEYNLADLEFLSFLRPRFHAARRYSWSDTRRLSGFPFCFSCCVSFRFRVRGSPKKGKVTAKVSFTWPSLLAHTWLSRSSQPRLLYRFGENVKKEQDSGFKTKQVEVELPQWNKVNELLFYLQLKSALPCTAIPKCRNVCTSALFQHCVRIQAGPCLTHLPIAVDVLALVLSEVAATCGRVFFCVTLHHVLSLKLHLTEKRGTPRCHSVASEKGGKARGDPFYLCPSIHAHEHCIENRYKPRETYIC